MARPASWPVRNAEAVVTCMMFAKRAVSHRGHDADDVLRVEVAPSGRYGYTRAAAMELLRRGMTSEETRE